MRNTYILFVLHFTFFGGTHNLLAQSKTDYQWVLGGNRMGEGLGLDFNGPDLWVETRRTGLVMEGSNTSVSDADGNLLFCSNGCKIVGANGDLLQNGDTINPGGMLQFYCRLGGGSPLRQGVLALPDPGNAQRYYVFNLDFELPYIQDTNFLGLAPIHLYYHVIDMGQSGGRGAVVSKLQIAVRDTFARGTIQAARHANGRDWWVIVPESHSNCYFLVLITPQGVQPPQRRCAGHIWDDEDFGTQAVFTPDQKKYIRFNAWNGLNIYDFDNATGALTNPVRMLFPDDTIRYTIGAAVSPNSRFLYICARKKAYQFDLQAANIEASKIKVAEWDGAFNPYATFFYMAALAPDGKIYISNSNGTLNLHVIHRPNCPGLECDIEQRGVVLPAYNGFTIPNFPHYRMSDENCLGVSAPLVGNKPTAVSVFPNPAHKSVWIDLGEYNPQDCTLRLFNAMGRCVLARHLLQNKTELDIAWLPNGTYYYTINNPNGRQSGKVVKVD